MFLRNQNSSKIKIIHIIVHKSSSTEDLIEFKNLKNIAPIDYLLSESRFIFYFREKHSLHFTLPINDLLSLDNFNLLKINISPDNNYIESANASMIYSDGLWSLLGEKNKPNATQIESGDIFRLGKQVIKTILFTPNNTNEQFGEVFDDIYPGFTHYSKDHFDYISEFNSTENEQDVSIRSSQPSLNELGSVCRICLGPESSNRKFANKICKCSMNMPIHVSCLIRYVRMKCKVVSFKNYLYYNLSHIFCDVCKEKYPKFIDVESKKQLLLKLKYPENKVFAALLVYKVGSSDIKNIIFIDLFKNYEPEIKFGSSEKCVIRFVDSSISPFHAHILIKNSIMYIYNDDQKLGTFKKITKRVKMDFLHNKVVVFGNFSMLFHINTKEKTCDCVKRANNNNLKNWTKNPVELNLEQHLSIVKQKAFELEKLNIQDIAVKQSTLHTKSMTQDLRGKINDLNDLSVEEDDMLVVNPSGKYPIGINESKLIVNRKILKENMLSQNMFKKKQLGLVIESPGKKMKESQFGMKEGQFGIKESPRKMKESHFGMKESPRKMRESQFGIKESPRKMRQSKLKMILKKKIEERESLHSENKSLWLSKMLLNSQQLSHKNGKVSLLGCEDYG